MTLRVLWLLSFLLISCSGCSDANGDNGKNEMQNAIKQAAFIYDLECIPLNKMARADTLWKIPISAELGNELFFAYVVTGDCSYCIADAINFFHTYYSIDCSRKLRLLIIKGDQEILKYYLSEEKFNEVESKKISALQTFNIDKDSMAQDGIYLIYNKRVINHVPFKS